jgi:hypothetical protein
VRNNLLPAESSTATWNGAQEEELLLRRQIAALYVRFEVVEPPEPIALASLNPSNQPPDQELAIPLSSRFYYGIHVCKCKQIKKEINSPSTQRDSNALAVASIGDTQHVRVCCGGNVERGEEEKCVVSLRLWTMLQRLALQSITDKNSPTHTLNTKQNQGGLSNKKESGTGWSSDFD